jgi:hypothetical protein
LLVVGRYLKGTARVRAQREGMVAVETSLDKSGESLVRAGMLGLVMGDNMKVRSNYGCVRFVETALLVRK